MKYLKSQVHDDHATLARISKNKSASSYPKLSEFLENLGIEYSHYVKAKGNAWDLNAPLLLPVGLKIALRTHYETKPDDLAVIDLIRDKASPDVCSMCGSPKPAEVDHVVPKDAYPEFSFFTKNLVPACDCNGFKGVAFKGALVGQRVLHPYYDEVLRERLVYVHFSGDFDAPKAEIRIISKHASNPTVIFHVDEILRKTRLIYWAEKKWANIKRSPESVFPLFKSLSSEVSFDNAKMVVEHQVAAKDEEFETPNNWDSMVYFGVLLSPGALSYIAQRVNGLRAGTLCVE